MTTKINGLNEVAAIWNFCKQYNTSCSKINTEGIDNVDGQKSKVDSRKKIEAGQLLIDCNGHTYNAQGQEVK